MALARTTKINARPAKASQNRILNSMFPPWDVMMDDPNCPPATRGARFRAATSRGEARGLIRPALDQALHQPRHGQHHQQQDRQREHGRRPRVAQARAPAQHVLGRSAEAVQRTFLLRRRYYELLNSGWPPALERMKAYLEKGRGVWDLRGYE